MAATAHSFEVFRSLQEGDFVNPRFQEPLTEMVHDFFAGVEAAALSPSVNATPATETRRLLQGLDLAEAGYNYHPAGHFTATWVSTAAVPIVEGDIPFAIHFRTRIKASTLLDRSANPEWVSDVNKASWITVRRNMQPAHAVPEKQAMILGVSGKQVGSSPRRYEYHGDSDIGRQLRIALGDVMIAAAAQVGFEVDTAVGTHPHPIGLRAKRVFWLETAEPASPADTQLAHFSVLNELVSRSISGQKIT
jgi:hypothetical protein